MLARSLRNVTQEVLVDSAKQLNCPKSESLTSVIHVKQVRSDFTGALESTPGVGGRNSAAIVRRGSARVSHRRNWRERMRAYSEDLAGLAASGRAAAGAVRAVRAGDRDGAADGRGGAWDPCAPAVPA